MRFPNFLGLGTQKGGTTTLHRLLLMHSQVFLPECKEVHYFDLNYHRGDKWYSHHYCQSNPAVSVFGDITPFYLFHPAVPERIRRTLPNAKLIILLRDPVERTLSHYFHARRRGFECLDLEDALQAETSRLATGDIFHLQKHSYLSRSKYLEQLDRYEDKFAKDQILILRSEDMFATPLIAWKRLQHFLHLDEQPLPHNIQPANQGMGESVFIDSAIRDDLQSQLLQTALGVRKRYGFGWDWA